jgi:hypothetical protein
MNQKLSDWASIAEIVSGVAVIVTLVILIIGVRENTETVRASTFASNLNALNDFQTALVADSEALRAWDAFMRRSNAGLDELDERRLTLIVTTFFNIYENAYYFEKYGLVGAEGWERFDRNVCGFFDRAWKVGQAEVLEQILSNEFHEYISAKCSG